MSADTALQLPVAWYADPGFHAFEQEHGYSRGQGEAGPSVHEQPAPDLVEVQRHDHRARPGLGELDIDLGDAPLAGPEDVRHPPAALGRQAVPAGDEHAALRAFDQGAVDPPDDPTLPAPIDDLDLGVDGGLRCLDDRERPVAHLAVALDAGQREPTRGRGTGQSGGADERPSHPHGAQEAWTSTSGVCSSALP
jgi:hypothetical protein